MRTTDAPTSPRGQNSVDRFVQGRHLRRVLGIGVLVAAALASTTACGSGADPATSAPSAPQEPVPVVDSTSAPRAVRDDTETRQAQEAAPPVGDVHDPAADVAAAVAYLVGADSYRFEAAVNLAVSDPPTTLELTGWVRGDDRELVLRSGDTVVITRVVDGFATVERDGEITEVPLSAADTGPRFAMLDELVDVTSLDDDTVFGTLTPEALQEHGFDVPGAANVTVFLADGALEGYSMSAQDQAWSIDVRFSDVGAVEAG